MEHLDITADELVSALLHLAETEPVCILDSSGVSHLGSHLLLAGIGPVQTHEIRSPDALSSLKAFDELLAGSLAAVFTLSYEFGRKIQGFKPSQLADAHEPDIFISLFDVLIVHDYSTSSTQLVGNSVKFPAIGEKLLAARQTAVIPTDRSSIVRSDFTRNDYLQAIAAIKERIRCGDTYQTNLTQRLTARLPYGLTAELIFATLRGAHPAPFSAFIKRSESTVVSVSPERFFLIEGGVITTSPIKGTRPRGRTPEEDNAFRRELLTSPKERAENTMIVDLLRNDLGRVCEYGSVHVEKLCELEEHPSLFHLVSTVSGRVKPNTVPSSVLTALFPCGSITGAPKISTMRIIDDIERSPRGLSMGAIGYYIPPASFGLPERLETSVAIRTMVVRDRIATFNVGGGIVIDSDPEQEYEESLTKASALMNAINGERDFEIGGTTRRRPVSKGL